MASKSAGKPPTLLMAFKELIFDALSGTVFLFTLQGNLHFSFHHRVTEMGAGVMGRLIQLFSDIFNTQFQLVSRS